MKTPRCTHSHSRKSKRMLSVIGLTMLLTVNPHRARAGDFDWAAAIEKALEELALSTQPEAIKPIVEAAANADSIALSALTTAAYAARIKLVAKDADEPVPDFDKQLKALNAILAL